MNCSMPASIARQIAGKPAANPSEKPIVLAIASQDINCPTVDIPEGGAALRVGGADNASVRLSVQYRRYGAPGAIRQVPVGGVGEDRRFR